MLRLRHERIARGWSLRYVGRMVGSSNSTINRIETGQVEPLFGVMHKLEHLFGIPAEELLQEIAEPEAAEGG